ncbi:MAG: hypothetical protein JNK88_08445 [Mangrovicoccus sp.]|nr:hypothetical protein [Mangrovicoccus sp.]
MSFIRRLGGDAVFCAFNLSGQTGTVTLPEGDWVVDTGAPFACVTTGRAVDLPPYQACFAVRSDGAK